MRPQWIAQPAEADVFEQFKEPQRKDPTFEAVRRTDATIYALGPELEGAAVELGVVKVFQLTPSKPASDVSRVGAEGTITLEPPAYVFPRRPKVTLAESQETDLEINQRPWARLRERAPDIGCTFLQSQRDLQRALDVALAVDADAGVSSVEAITRQRAWKEANARVGGKFDPQRPVVIRLSLVYAPHVLS